MSEMLSSVRVTISTVSKGAEQLIRGLELREEAESLRLLAEHNHEALRRSRKSCGDFLRQNHVRPW